ncbi:probable peptide chain release factor C12orf65 homolog, mitochondrial [Galendromus occidentalis]|uniref:Probable peptide chain release factor C12orf65 homolog, mitochondrial n=1 Tax=Galendromus occidentalis TaxID=34638 RepID=A0AAJ7PAB3_9ACAR|nr:probable peptide chain release factor C12orf65 homolog, mitochondrial [Galendromus occidentalis]
MALSLLARFAVIPRHPVSITALRCASKKVDKSRVPVIGEEDIIEQFVKGSGPGGQSVNKTVNCVVLCHRPTGVVVRCHESRLQHQNRRMARQLLVEKVDDFINGEMSVRNQKIRIERERKIKAEQRAKKLREKKRLEKEEKQRLQEEEEEEEGLVDRWTKFQRAQAEKESS